MSDYGLIIIIILLFIALIGLIIILRKLRLRGKRNIKVERLENYLESIGNIETKPDKPNIILILTDDLGYEDISCFSAKTIKTPYIDKLAKNGVIFTNFYSSSPICSPSRAGILTGRYPVRTHVPTVFMPSKSILSHILSLLLYSYGMKGISPDEITLPEALKKVGYTTGMLGKWHLGDKSPYLPNDKGFDFFYGALYSNDMKPYEIYRNKEIELKAPVNQDNLTKLLTEEGIKFIKKNKDKPFFLYYAQPFPHVPLHASDDFKGTSQAGIYGDAVQEIDWSIGKIFDILEENGLTENTLILFTSDNGPWHQGNPGYARGRKGLTFEGGQRVPFIACWPKRIPSGIKTDVPVMNIDLFPTILNIVGIPLPKDRIIDGKDITAYLIDQNEGELKRPLFYFWNKKLQAIRYGKWKYHIRHRSDVSSFVYLKLGPFLFDLKKDPNESYNLTPHFPEKGIELNNYIDQMRKELKNNLRGWI